MSREVRAVPANWQHPKDENGKLIPLHDGAEFQARLNEWDEGAKKWNEGFRVISSGELVPLSDEQKAQSYAWWVGSERPDPSKYMPLWNDSERTHLMMYEVTTVGTPISPACANAEELARWLADNNVAVFGKQEAPYEMWLSIIANRYESMPIFTK